MRDIIATRTPTPTVTQTPSPTPTPTPTPAEEPAERYSLEDAFPPIQGLRYRKVPARILRNIVRRWRSRMGGARRVVDGPRVRYLVEDRRVAATSIAFAARGRFDAFVREVLREDSGRPALGPGTRGVTRRADRGLWEIAFARGNLLVVVVAVNRRTAERIGRTIARAGG